MKLKTIYVSQRGYYSINVDEESGQFIMGVETGGLISGELYIRLTDEEVGEFNNDSDALDRLAKDFGADKGKVRYKDRHIIP